MKKTLIRGLSEAMDKGLLLPAGPEHRTCRAAENKIRVTISGMLLHATSCLCTLASSKTAKQQSQPGQLANAWVAMLACILLACNPLRRIDIKNESDGEATVQFVVKEDSLMVSPFNLHNSTELRFRLQAQSPYNLVRFSFGVGHWTETSLQQVTDDLERLEIHTVRSRLRLEGPEAIQAFLWPKLRGITQRKIQLVLKDSMP